MSAGRATARGYGAEMSPGSAARASRKGSPLPRITEWTIAPSKSMSTTCALCSGSQLRVVSNLVDDRQVAVPGAAVDPVVRPVLDVDPVLARPGVDAVGAWARIDAVVAAAAQEPVASAPAGDPVVAAAAGEPVVAGAAGEAVIAREPEEDVVAG